MLTFFPPRPRTPAEQEEDACVTADWCRFRAARGTAFWNWFNDVNSLKQPGGYAVAFEPSATFVRDPFLSARLAFGVSIFAITFEDIHPDELPEEDRVRILRLWSALISEKSPRPPDATLDFVKGDWVAALSPGGSVRLLKLNDDRHRGVWYLQVASALPWETEEKFKKSMIKWQGAGPDLTHASGFVLPKPATPGSRTFENVAAKEFAQYIALAKENRARIAALAAHIAGGKFVRVVDESVIPDHPPVAVEYSVPSSGGDGEDVVERALDALGKLGVPPDSDFVPVHFVESETGFALGAAIARPEISAQVRARASVLVHSPEPLVDCAWNVLVPSTAANGSSKDPVWYCECAPAFAPEHSVVIFDDPVLPVRVLNWPLSVVRHPNRRAITQTTLGAFPNVVPRSYVMRPPHLTESGVRFNARSAAQELAKHSVTQAKISVQEHTMVMATWSSAGLSQDQIALWEFPRAAEALLTTKLAVHASKAYDGCDRFPTLEEIEFDAVM